MDFSWLPEAEDWATSLAAVGGSSAGWDAAVQLSKHRINATQTNALDRAVQEEMTELSAEKPTWRPIRLAILGSCTTAHLHSAIRVAGIRRKLLVQIYEPDYGQYWQALSEPGALQSFEPTAILLALDAYLLTAAVNPAMTDEEAEAALDAAVERIRQCWDLAAAFGCPIIQSVPLPVCKGLMGSNEHRLLGSHQTFIRRLSERLRDMADAEGVDLLALDTRAAADGIAAWHDQDLWFHAKQEIAPRAAPFFGDLLVRILAAQLGLSSKCLVLDLDNTLWGGVIADDGMEGIELGQGTAVGEAFVAVQEYAKALSQRGVILAVCSKNDERNALEPFERHPEMVLRRSDIACFVANWDDKPSNLRSIAEQLNIGLDALVFLDDNPFERALVRRELPMVSVPEIDDDPTMYPRVLEDAGYFEATRITAEDRQRAAHYRGNAERARLRETTSDLAGYLASLDARLTWRPFDRLGLARIVQLTNKTNQFNLTTRRYSEADVLAVMDDPRCFGLQLRLVDRLGDNGMIAVVVGRLEAPSTVLIETWLMSCRVLGRGVETAILGLLVDQALRLGADRIVGEYRPSGKNGMVQDLYPRLGFRSLGGGEDGAARFGLVLSQFKPQDTTLSRVEEETARD